MKPHTIWLYGLSGAGKTTLAQEIKNHLQDYILLDGDELRTGINNDLGFDDSSRSENTRRTIEICKILNKNKINMIVSLITPFKKDRELIKDKLNAFMIYLNCPLRICKQRDPKGLYKKEIKNFTGIDSDFQIGIYDLEIETAKFSIWECREIILNSLFAYNFIDYETRTVK